MLTVAAFDQDVEPIYTGRASALGDIVRRRITERRALGASDLDRALRWAADSARAAATRRTRVLLVTDGVATAGETGGAQLRQRVKALAGAGVERLDVLAVGGIREDALLAQLVTAGLARDGVVLDAAQPPAALAHRLTRATRSGIKLEVDGAGWIWPNTLNGVQPGDEVLVYADLPAGKPLRVKANGQPLALAGTLAPVDRPLLERAWVKARIARLLDLHDRGETGGADPDMKDVFKKQAIELSIKNRVLCPVHLAAGARDRAGLRALRHRAARAGRRDHRRRRRHRAPAPHRRGDGDRGVAGRAGSPTTRPNPRWRGRWPNSAMKDQERSRRSSRRPLRSPRRPRATASRQERAEDRLMAKEEAARRRPRPVAMSPIGEPIGRPRRGRCAPSPRPWQRRRAPAPRAAARRAPRPRARDAATHVEGGGARRRGRALGGAAQRAERPGRALACAQRADAGGGCQRFRRRRRSTARSARSTT